MPEKELCGCDDSKEWKARAFSSELALKLVRQQLTRLIERVDAALRIPGDVIDSEFAEVDEPAEGAVTLLTDEGERRVPGEYREEVLASGAAEAIGGAVLGPMLSREDVERELRRLAVQAPPKTTAEYAAEAAKMDPNAWRRLVLRMAELIPARSKSERP